MRARIRQLGFGRRATRADLERVCGGFSKANHFLDATTKLGLLVPVRWGEYQVVDEDTIDLLAKVPLSLHQRFVSWARVLPRLAHHKIAFLGPRLWKHSELNFEEPAPILRLGPNERMVARPAPQWGAFLYDLDEPETWVVDVDGEEAARIGVPNWFDSLVLVRSNADPRWRATAAQWEARIAKKDSVALEHALATLKRIPNPGWGLPALLGPGPPVRKRLVTPSWYESAHRDALETFARGLHG
jgi:hypothetical protein